jgi:hypothetical protein
MPRLAMIAYYAVDVQEPLPVIDTGIVPQKLRRIIYARGHFDQAHAKDRCTTPLVHDEQSTKTTSPCIKLRTELLNRYNSHKNIQSKNSQPRFPTPNTAYHHPRNHASERAPLDFRKMGSPKTHSPHEMTWNIYRPPARVSTARLKEEISHESVGARHEKKPV